MNRIVTAVVLFSILFTSCKKDDNLKGTGSNYLMFGHFYGECLGEHCIEIFQLGDDQLLEDTADTYPSYNSFYNGHYKALSQQQFDSTKDLINYFPPDLLQETTTVIGKPDEADGGGLYIEYNFDGVREFWLLDQVQSNVPDKYHSFIDKVNEKIELLQ